MVYARLLCIGAYILLPVLLIASIWASNPARFSSSALIPLALGAMAYTFFCVQLVLTARLKWLDRLFGLDRLIRFHGIAAMAALLLALGHKLMMHGGVLRYRPSHWGDMALTLYVLAAVLAVCFLTSFFTRHVACAAAAREALSRFSFTRYDVQLTLHHLNAAAVVLMFTHVAFKPFMRNGFTGTLLGLYFAVGIGCYLWHMFLRPRHRMTVAQVIRENGQMTTLVLRPEEGSVFTYLPGQFAYLRIQDPALSSEAHPFSISSAPEDKERLTVTIKQLGDWTSRVKDIHPGSLVMVDGPYGRFSPVLLPGRPPLVLIAGGVGITPMMGIISHYAHADPEREILLIWCAANRQELIRQEEWETYEKDMPHFTWFPILSRDPECFCEKGRISKELMEKALQKADIDPAEAQFYFCGPAPMTQTVSGILQMMNVPGNRIHSERFSM